MYIICSRILVVALLWAAMISLASGSYSNAAEEYQLEPIEQLRQKRGSNIAADPSTVDDLWKLPPEIEVQNDTTDHQYYVMEMYSNQPEKLKQFYVDVDAFQKNPNVKGNKSHPLLTSSYRRAVSAKISFDFPFYGHRMRNLTIATGGFSYIGDQTHSWLAATQYIAPLMANFETTRQNANILYADDGNQFIIEWKEVVLRDQQEGPFTFQVILKNTGDIYFLYKEIPIAVENISDSHHPCKLGISDAYLFHHNVLGQGHFSSAMSKRVIYEYHRIEVPPNKVVSNTVVILRAQQTCIGLTTCAECSNATVKNFNCSWCHSKKSNGGPFCTDQAGLHRRRQQWIEGNCKDQGKNMYCSTEDSESEKEDTEKDSDEMDDVTKSPSDGSDKPDGDSGGKPAGSPDQVVPLDGRQPRPATSNVANAQEKDASSNTGNGYMFVMTVMLSVFLIGGWLLYAYYNPHSTSGQLLIRYRPSRWRVPSSHVRYSASVHM